MAPNQHGTARRARKGFTLAEILVTLAILAVLSAVLLPALNSQIGKGDAGRVTNDLVAIRVASQAFLSDVHRYPSNIAHLNAPITNVMTDVLGSTYPAALTSKWKGPYLAKEVIGPTPLGTISQGLTSTAGANGLNYLTVTMTNVPFADFAKIEEIVDENSATSTSSTTGNIRWASNTLSFLALPIQ